MPTCSHSPCLPALPVVTFFAALNHVYWYHWSVHIDFMQMPSMSLPYHPHLATSNCMNIPSSLSQPNFLSSSLHTPLLTFPQTDFCANHKHRLHVCFVHLTCVLLTSSTDLTLPEAICMGTETRLAAGTCHSDAAELRRRGGTDLYRG
jgi:hypothetical protein